MRALVSISAFPNVQSVWFTSKQLLVPGAALGDGKSMNLFDVTNPAKPTLLSNAICGPGLDMRFMVRAGGRVIVADEHTLAFSEESPAPPPRPSVRARRGARSPAARRAPRDPTACTAAR
jgi:hypothetical protein